jgi:hypothetical protein
MPWRDARTIPLTRIDIVSQVPSESGVYGILDGAVCLLVGEAWNLKARLLEFMNVLHEVGELSVIYELCREEERAIRKETLAVELIRHSPPPEIRSRELPGITFEIQCRNSS